MVKICYLMLDGEMGFGYSAKSLIGMIEEFDGVELDAIPLNKPIENSAIFETKYDLLISHIGLNSILSEVKNNNMIKQLFANSKKKICYVLWEADRLAKSIEEGLDELFDEFIAPSQFVSDLLSKSISKAKIHKIPITINDHVFTLRTDDKKRDQFTLLSIGQWSARKCFDIMTVAYATAFAGQTDVRIFFKLGERIMQDNPDAVLKANITKSMIAKPPPIYLIDEHLSQEQIDKLYNISNAYLHISRGEGFGMTPLTAMARGLPVIYTDWSAHKEFCDKDDRNIKVDGNLDLVHSMGANYGYEPEQKWFEPSVESCVIALREMYDRWKDGKIDYTVSTVIDNYKKENVSELAYEMIFSNNDVKFKPKPKEVNVGDMSFFSV